MRKLIITVLLIALSVNAAHATDLVCWQDLTEVTCKEDVALEDVQDRAPVQTEAISGVLRILVIKAAETATAELITRAVAAAWEAKFGKKIQSKNVTLLK